jgi:hypothetical protein
MIEFGTSEGLQSNEARPPDWPNSKFNKERIYQPFFRYAGGTVNEV